MKIEEEHLYQVDFGEPGLSSMFGYSQVKPALVLATSMDQAAEKAIISRMTDSKQPVLSGDGSLNNMAVPEVRSVILISNKLIY